MPTPEIRGCIWRNVSRNGVVHANWAERLPRRSARLRRTRHPRGPSAADLRRELSRRTVELAEAREQQAATTEVLQVISSSRGRLGPVFEAMLANAMRICAAQCGFIYKMEAGAMRAMAEIGVPPALAEYRQQHFHTGGATTPVDLMRATKKPAHIPDAREKTLTGWAIPTRSQASNSAVRGRC